MLTILRMMLGKAGWLLLSFVIIVAFLALWHELPAKMGDWNWQARNLQTAAAALRTGEAGFAQSATLNLKTADSEIAVLKRAGDRELVRAEDDLQQRRSLERSRILDTRKFASAALTGRTDKITASLLAQYVNLPLLDRAAAFIALRRANLKDLASYNAAVRAIERTRRRHNDQVLLYNRRLGVLRSLRVRANNQWQNPVCRTVELPAICSLVREVREQESELRNEKRRLARSRRALQASMAALRSIQLRPEQVPDGASILETANQAYRDETTRISDWAESQVPNKLRRALRSYGWQAFWLVLTAAVLPILHKLFAFLVIAPAARRSRPVRLHEWGPSLAASASAISVQVRIDGDSELLLRSGLQSSATDVYGSDRYVFDWRMPLTCVAAGLINLQRLRSKRPDYVVVTGTNPEHRVATIMVPANGAVVLQPRALLGVVKPRGKRLVITRPWRIGWLISWITAQFRYIVFHGPCTLIVQGRNGVEVERAARGRMINKRLTIGFDAALAYGAARSPSFLPYLRGQASLFNDRFEGEGQYLYEQRADGAGRGGLWGRGLKGIGDAVLSALGI